MLRKLFLITLLALLSGACTSTPPTPTAAITGESAAETAAPPESTAAPAVTPTPSIILSDGLDRRVELYSPAQRIISLAPSNTEILFAIGAGSQMVGRDDFSDFPEEAKKVESIGATFGDLNTETIVALKPDLVLAAEINSPEQVKTLEDLGLTVFWLGNPLDFPGLYDNISIVGQLTGREQEAAALNDSLVARVNAVTGQLVGSGQRPKVFYEVDGSDPTKPWTTGRGTFIATVIALAGGDNVGSVLPEQYAQISSEELIQQNPEFIILGDSAFGVTPESIGQRPGWAAIAAVQKGQVYPFDDNLVSRPGPRLVDGLEAMAKILNPTITFP
jgi:iron complex transport system substrate-binding protein